MRFLKDKPTTDEPPKAVKRCPHSDSFVHVAPNAYDGLAHCRDCGKHFKPRAKKEE